MQGPFFLSHTINPNQQKQRDLSQDMYNPFLVYCRELAPATVSLTGDRAKGDDSKHDSHYSAQIILFRVRIQTCRGLHK